LRGFNPPTPPPTNTALGLPSLDAAATPSLRHCVSYRIVSYLERVDERRCTTGDTDDETGEDRQHADC